LNSLTDQNTQAAIIAHTPKRSLAPLFWLPFGPALVMLTGFMLRHGAERMFLALNDRRAAKPPLLPLMTFLAPAPVTTSLLPGIGF
jgi:hypothetical protein